MINSSNEIEENMAFLLNPKSVKNSIAKDNAIEYLKKAKNLLENAKLHSYANEIVGIIKMAESSNDSDIEVE